MGASTDKHLELAVEISLKGLNALFVLNAGAAASLIALTDKAPGGRDYSLPIIWFGAGTLATVISFALAYFSQLAYANEIAASESGRVKTHFKHIIFQNLAILSVIIALGFGALGMYRAYSIAHTQDPASASESVFQHSTATEIFNLRSRCAELGDKLLDDQRAGMGPALYADAKSHYEPKTNRCYVEVDVSPSDLQAPNWKTTQRLYDGQTKENLAWFTTSGPAHPEDDRCMEYLDMPINRTCREINERILAIMADTRKY